MGDCPPVEEVGKANIAAVDGRWLIVRKSLKRQPHGVSSTERPRYPNQNLWAQRGHQAGILLSSCHPRHLQNYPSTPVPNTLSPRCCRPHPSKFPAKISKGAPVRHAKIVQLRVAIPRVGAVDVGTQQPQKERGRFRSRGSACEGVRHLPKQASIKVVRGTVVDLSGVMARSKGF